MLIMKASLSADLDGGLAVVTQLPILSNAAGRTHVRHGCCETTTSKQRHTEMLELLSSDGLSQLHHDNKSTWWRRLYAQHDLCRREVYPQASDAHDGGQRRPSHDDQIPPLHLNGTKWQHRAEQRCCNDLE